MNGPYLTRERGRYRIEWPSPEHAVLEFDLLRPGRDGELTAEVTATSTLTTGGRLAVSRLNLTSTRSRSEFASYLTKRSSQTPWSGLIETACQEVVVAYRKGAPALLLRDAKEPEDAGYLLPPLVVGRLPTVLFGDGGNGKSYLALAAALSIHTGRPILGLNPTTTKRVGIFDWELDAWEHRSRMAALLGEDSPDIVYVPCARPLADDVDRLRRVIDEHDLEFVVVDSVGLACDGPPEAAEVANRFYAGLRELGVGSLLVAHVNRSGDTERPFGSAFWSNSARSTWFLKRESSIGDGSMTLALFNKKSNLHALAAPLGYRFTFEADRTAIERTDVRDIPDIARHVPLSYRITDALRTGSQTAHELATAMDSDVETVSRTLRRLRSRDKVRDLPGPDGILRWGLAA